MNDSIKVSFWFAALGASIVEILRKLHSVCNMLYKLYYEVLSAFGLPFFITKIDNFIQSFNQKKNTPIFKTTIA